MPEPEGLRSRLRALYQQDDVRAFFKEQGARGGKIGGPRRTDSMTPEQRSALAQKAARARWAKAKKRKKR